MSVTQSPRGRASQRRAALAAVLLLTLVATSPRAARAAEDWQTGPATQTSAYNCITQTDQVTTINTAAYFGERGGSPVVGQPYSVMVDFSVTGNPCSGQVEVHDEFFLPQGTQLAISAANPVQCFLIDFTAHTSTEDTINCPQAAQNGLQGGLAFDPIGAGGWVTPQGYEREIMVPVVSSQPLNGQTSGDCASCLTVGLWVIDGDQNPWTYPQVGVNVVAGATPSPSPAPSATPQPSASPSSSPAPSFPDVPTSHPYYQAITQLAAHGVIKGYQDGTFGPGDPTLRAQMAALIARASGWDAEDWGNSFPDRGQVDDALWRNVGTLAHYGVAKGYPDGQGGSYYDPTNNVLNAQVLSFITRAMIVKGTWQQQPDDPALYPNIPASSGHRQDLATYVHYAGAVPETTPSANWSNWDLPATRGWFAQALWQAINK